MAEPIDLLGKAEPVLWAVFTADGLLVRACRTRWGALTVATIRVRVAGGDRTAVVAPLYRGDDWRVVTPNG